MSVERKKDNFIKQAGILAIAGIVCRIIGILYRSPLTHIIGDEGNGYYSSAYNIYTIILMVSSYSIPSAISKEIALKLAVKEYKNAQRVFHCAIFYVIFIGGVASILTFFGASLVVETNSVIVLKLFAPTILFSGLLGVLRGYFQAHRSMFQTSMSQIIEQLLNAVISILAAYILIKTVAGADATTQAIYGATGSAMGTGAGVIIALLFMWLVYLYNRGIIRKRILQDRISQVASYKQIFKNIFFAVTPIILSTFIYNFNTPLNQTIYTKILLHLKNFSEPEIAIQYGIFTGKAVVIANIPIAIASAIAAAIIPSISRTYIQGNMKATNQKVDTAIHTTMLISIPAAVGLAVLSRPVVQVLFPQKESLVQAASLLRGLSITVIFYSLSTLTNGVLQGIGKVNLPVINAMISLIIQTIVFVFILLNTKLNLSAFVISAALYSTLMCLLNGIAVYKNLKYRQNIKKNFLIPLVAAAIMGTVTGFLYKLVFTISRTNIISLIFSICFALVIYFILIIKLGGVSEEDLEGFPKGKTIVILAKRIRIL